LTNSIKIEKTTTTIIQFHNDQ